MSLTYLVSETIIIIMILYTSCKSNLGITGMI